jgi:hypothetical protein
MNIARQGKAAFWPCYLSIIFNTELDDHAKVKWLDIQEVKKHIERNRRHLVM